MAPMIPDKPLFIVTSALNSDMGVVNRNDRLEQTLRGLLSLRKKVPNALVLLTDGSPHKLEPEKLEALKRYVNIVADFSSDTQVSQFAINHRKSEAENVLMIKTLLLLKQDHGLMKMMQSVNRVFKISARSDILDGFDLKEHNHFGKYVFKKRIPTWLSDSRKDFATDLLITRMFSFCPSLIDNYVHVMHDNIRLIAETGIDTEHAHFVNIPPQKLLELDTIHCQGIMAGTGLTEIY